MVLVVVVVMVRVPTVVGMVSGGVSGHNGNYGKCGSGGGRDLERWRWNFEESVLVEFGADAGGRGNGGRGEWGL